MLNLSRKVGEAYELDLGDGQVVIVQVKKISGSTVILGIDAPQTVRIGYKHLGGRPRQAMPSLAQDRADDSGPGQDATATS